MNHLPMQIAATVAQSMYSRHFTDNGQPKSPVKIETHSVMHNIGFYLRILVISH
jgi:hypothetical protein